MDLKVKDTQKIVNDAYHGTSKENAVKIVGTGQFIPSDGEDCFYGDGVYFFESGKGHAQWWAAKKYPGTNIKIIVAVINLGRCFDLGNPDHVRALNYFREQILLKGLRKNLTDTFLLNHIAKRVCKEIETVRGYDLKGRLAESRLPQFTHVIICVKKLTNILSFRLAS